MALLDSALLNFKSHPKSPPLMSSRHYELNKHRNNIAAALFLNYYSSSSSTTTFVKKKKKKKKEGLISVRSSLKTTETQRATTSQAISVAEAPLVTTWSTTTTTALTLPPELQRVKRSDFPPDFQFGGSASALQTEGAGPEGGRGPSTWDFMMGDGNKAANSYNLWKEDVEVMKKMGMNSYRMSISWSRILPKGTIKGGINQEGIDFYNNFIDELIANEINPVVTLFHFDLPQALQDEYHGFLSKRIIKDFQAYAELCFKTFGDRVKLWATINEPSVVVGYHNNGIIPELAPGSNLYKATHNVLLAHAAAAKAYKQNYQMTQGGEVGISLSFKWLEPLSDSPQDKVAAQNAIDFEVGMYMNPLCYGDYPKIMKDKLAGFPVFTKEERELVKGSYDWIGINYYTARYVTLASYSTVDREKGHIKVFYSEEKVDRNGELIGPLAPGSTDCYIYPDGLRDALLYMKNKYNDPLLYITENGITSDHLRIKMSIKEAMATENQAEIDKTLNDHHRVDHIIIHLLATREAINQGAKVKGYFVWSMLDSLEFSGRYNNRTGLCYTDYLDDHKRYLKKSGEWFYNFNTLKENKCEINIVGQQQGIKLLTLLACVSIYAWILNMLTARK